MAKPTFYKEIRHSGLNEAKVITGTDQRVVDIKAAQQLEVWDEKWRRRQEAKQEQERRNAEATQEQRRKREAVEKERQAKLAEREEEREIKASKKQNADLRTAEAKAELDALGSILSDAVTGFRPLDWAELEDHSQFDAPRPEKRAIAAPPPLAIPPEPQWRQPELHQLKLGVLDQLLPKRRQAKITQTAAANRQLTETATNQHEKELEDWRAHVAKLREEAGRAASRHKQLLAQSHAEYERQVETWSADKAAFERQQQESNAAIAELQTAYMSCAVDAVTQYCHIVLGRCSYPDDFPYDVQLEYRPDTRILVIDYALPRLEDLPRLKEVKYVQSRDEFSESELSERELQRLYEALLYQIALRAPYELYVNDAAEAIASIVFNGWVTSLDTTVGKETVACIMSFQSMKEGFLDINMADVDPKACFKNLKGIGSSQLYSLTPVAPVIATSHEDPRFVSSYGVASSLDEGYNLAAMDWEDFEHLIRELFAQEFSQNGGEVKVTQASRDGGVDAIAFDPDPIRGGKIVIQAKRYTNVVGVSAVRDLYGTVMNEGATKGILVTTSDYGPDAHEFANGKPLTLLSGGNLLHLLAKHGHTAKIDLKEAKQMLADREKEQ